MLFPPLLDHILSRSAWDGQITSTPETPGRPDNLDAPVEADVGARGRFGGRAKARALTLDDTRLRLSVGVGLASLALGAGSALARRRNP